MFASDVNHTLLSEILGDELETVLEEESQVEEDSIIDQLVTLRAAYATFQEEHVFYPGQLVTWKPRMRNRSNPQEGEPAIVVQVLAEPLLDTENGSNLPYFMEPLDLALGIIDDDGDLLIYHYDHRRFKPFV